VNKRNTDVLDDETIYVGSKRRERDKYTVV